MKPDELISHSQQQHEAHFYTRTQELNNLIQPVNLCDNPNYMQNAPAAPKFHQRQPFMATNYFHRQLPILRSPTFKENLGYPQQSHAYHMQSANAVGNRPILQGNEQKKQICQYWGQGRCYFGDRCKFLHEIVN